jgi:tetratricopeptide (TPR) repeat protein
MATYKKKGYKKEKKNLDELEYLVKDTDSTTAEVFTSLDESASKIELFIEKNQKWIFAGLIAIIVAVGAYMFYDSNIKKPHEQEAVNNLVKAQEFFDKAINEKDEKIALENFDKALKGDEGKYGFKQVAEKFAGTKAGNLSNYYLGMIYLKKGDFKEAVSYLSKFNGNDDILQPTALGAIGDAFLELEQNADALSYFEKAAKASDNEFTSPKYYLRAGKLALETGDKTKAKAFFTIIKEKYEKSKEAKDIDIYLAQAE